MILNYLDDETAKKGVIYLYKTPQGHTKSIPFFSIPSLAKKLTVMGPGEAFVDTNLTKLADEIAGLDGEEALKHASSSSQRRRPNRHGRRHRRRRDVR